VRLFTAAAFFVVVACNVSYGVAPDGPTETCATCGDSLVTGGDHGNVIQGGAPGTVDDGSGENGGGGPGGSTNDGGPVNDGGASNDGGTGNDGGSSNDAGSDAASDAAPPVQRPVISNIRLNGVARTTIQVAWSATVQVAFSVANAPTSCQINGTVVAGTSGTVTAPAANGQYGQTIRCSNSAGSSTADFIVQAQDVGRWYQANSQNCVSYCPTQGGRANAQSPYGFRCASGERQAPWPADRVAYGDFSYTYGVWPGTRASGDNTPGNTSSNGSNCYSPGQNTDGDSTDRTVACFCKML